VNYHDWLQADSHSMKNLGILLSGRGSNFEAIAANVSAGRIPDAQIVVVISNKPDAGGLETARRLGLTTLVIPSKGKEREAHDHEVIAALNKHLAPARLSWTGSAGAGVCLRRKSRGMHRPLCG
jgi:hypothetical protein